VDTVTVMRTLRGRPRLVGAVALLAALAGFLLTYSPGLPPEPRQHTVGVAKARVLVDTPKSQVVEVTPRGSETLPSRASLLANIMAEGEVKADIARIAGLEPRRLLASTDSAIEPATVPAKAADNPKAHLLTTGVVLNQDGLQLPIIKIEAQAPTVTRAVTLANAAVTGLGNYLESKAAAEELSFARRLTVSALGGAQGTEEVRGPGPLIGLAGFIFIFLLGCAAILFGSALARGWHQAGEAPLIEEEPADDAIVDDPFDQDDIAWLDPDREREAPADTDDFWLDLPDSEPAFGPPTSPNGDSSAAGEAGLKSS
jgi:hypothetical protein